MKDLNTIQGSLIGGAIGDALGYPVEFYRKKEIFNHYGPDGIREFALNEDGLAEISDDTQMTLFTAQGLLQAQKRNPKKDLKAGQKAWIKSIAESYRDWYQAQTEYYPADNHTNNWLLDIWELYERRAPGHTCMMAIGSGQEGSIAHPLNNSKGCGGIMRVGPIGLFFERETDINEVDLLAAQAAALSHGHQLGYIPAAMLAHILYKISQEDASILEAVKDAMRMVEENFAESEETDYLLALINQAILLSQQDLADIDAIEQLGEGWVAEETLAIAIYCVLKYSDDFEQGVIASVNHDGDSDSTGAVTGNILGAALGYQAIPEKFKENLELKETLLKMTQLLWEN